VGTVHLGLLRKSYSQTTAQFLDGYAATARLTNEDAAIIPLFQQLRIALQLNGTTQPEHVADLRRWLEGYRRQYRRSRTRLR
jgi:Ser/Thr protein kinase RdoA (MazF antagonist)